MFENKKENIFIKAYKVTRDVLYQISSTFLIYILFVPIYITLRITGKVTLPLDDFLNEIIEGYKSR